MQQRQRQQHAELQLRVHLLLHKLARLGVERRECVHDIQRQADQVQAERGRKQDQEAKKRAKSRARRRPKTAVASLPSPPDSNGSGGMDGDEQQRRALQALVFGEQWRVATEDRVVAALFALYQVQDEERVGGSSSTASTSEEEEVRLSIEEVLAKYASKSAGKKRRTREVLSSADALNWKELLSFGNVLGTERVRHRALRPLAQVYKDQFEEVLAARTNEFRRNLKLVAQQFEWLRPQRLKAVVLQVSASRKSFWRALLRRFEDHSLRELFPGSDPSALLNKTLERLQTMHSATLIQRAVRRWRVWKRADFAEKRTKMVEQMAERIVEQQRVAAVVPVLQAAFRTYFARRAVKQARAENLRRTRAARVIQRWARRLQRRGADEALAAKWANPSDEEVAAMTRVQAVARGFLCRRARHLELLREAACLRAARSHFTRVCRTLAPQYEAVRPVELEMLKVHLNLEEELRRAQTEMVAERQEFARRWEEYCRRTSAYFRSNKKKLGTSWLAQQDPETGERSFFNIDTGKVQTEHPNETELRATLRKESARCKQQLRERLETLQAYKQQVTAALAGKQRELEEEHARAWRIQ